MSESANITGREPDGWQNEYGHPVSRGGGHWPTDVRFWKVTEADLVARDETVRREVLAKVEGMLADLAMEVERKGDSAAAEVLRDAACRVIDMPSSDAGCDCDSCTTGPDRWCCRSCHDLARWPHADTEEGR